MLPDTIRNVKIGMAVFVVLFFGSIYGYFYFEQQRAVRSVRVGGRIETSAYSKRETELMRLEGRDPAAALKLADEMVAKPDSDRDKRVAMAARPKLIEWAAQRHLDAGRRAEAQALRERMEKQFPASAEAERLRGHWRSFLSRVATNAAAGGDRAAAMAAFRELWAERPGLAETHAFDQLAGHLVKRWREEHEAKSAGAGESLLAAAAVFTHREQVEQFGRDLTAFPGEASALAALGDEQARGPNRHAALALWQGGFEKLAGYAPLWRGEKLTDEKRVAAVKDELRRKLAAGWTDLGDRLRKGERPEFVLMSPRDAYEGAVHAGRGLVEEMEALTRRLEFEAGEVAQLAAPVLQQPVARFVEPDKIEYQDRLKLESACHDVQVKVRAVLERSGHRLWECCLDTPGFDPWPSVPVPVREAIDAKPAPAATRPGARGAAQPAVAPTEAARRKLLADYYRADFLHIPLGELEPLRATLHQVYARWGLSSLKSASGDGLERLREVLRESTDAGLRGDVVAALRQRFVSARQGGDFETFFVLAGFYAGEVGLPARGDPFRDQFRAGLEAALDGFKQGGQMKKIFILSLLAKCFPDEPVGREALREASVTAFSTVAMTPPENPNTIIRPSTVPGHAVHLIANGTEHHLLAFYRGPSLIMVHYWPWRRGTVVIPEGTYEVVVLSPSSSIKPYREQSSPASGVRLSEYIIQRKGDKPPGMARGSMFGGDYTLLYAPPGLGDLKVEPRTGMPVRTK